MPQIRSCDAVKAAHLDMWRRARVLHGATPEDYRRAYRDLVEVWHPDRLSHNERLRLIATDRLKEINEAYAYLMDSWKASRPSIRLPASTGRARVLCVDDDLLELKGLTRLLSVKFDVITAPNAQTGLDILLMDEAVAVVVSDLVMPGVDGIAFLRQAMIVSPLSTRILLTGYKEAISMAVALDKEFLFKILEKPCGDNRLLEIVQEGVVMWSTRSGSA